MPNSICCHFRGDTSAMFHAIMIIKLPLQQMGNGICAFPLQCCDLFPRFLQRVSSVSLRSAIWVWCCSFTRSWHPSGDTSDTANRWPTLGARPPTSDLRKPNQADGFQISSDGKRAWLCARVRKQPLQAPGLKSWLCSKVGSFSGRWQHPRSLTCGAFVSPHLLLSSQMHENNVY